MTGCSAIPLSSLNPFKEDKGLKVSAQVGKNNTQVQTDNKSLVSASTNDKTDIKNTSTSDNKANVVNQSTSTSSDKSGISTKNTSKTTNDNKAETINQASSTVTNYPTPAWIILLLVGMSGIAIPNPFNMLKDRRARKERERELKSAREDIIYLRELLRERSKEVVTEVIKIIEEPLAENI